MLQSELKVLNLPMVLPPLAQDTNPIRTFVQSALSEELKGQSDSYLALCDSLLENLRLLSIHSNLTDEELGLMRAATEFICAAWVAAPRAPERITDALCAGLLRTRPEEWKEREAILKHLIRIGLHPESRPITVESPADDIFRDAVIALETKKDSEELTTRRLAHSHTPTPSGAAWFKKELERVRRLKFRTVIGQLRFGKLLEKNINDLEETSSRFSNNPGSMSHQKMTLSIYRSVSRNMIDMITLADRKAGLLLNANAISLTLLLSFLGKSLLSNRKLWAPSILIAGTCAVTVIFASLAARPLRRKTGSLSLNDFLAADLSLIHYGDIARLSREDYLAGYQIAAQDAGLLEKSMLSEIHFFSKRIIEKFRMVRRAYLSMIAGIILSCLALLGSHYLE